MSIYNKETLKNIYIRKQAAAAFASGDVTQETLDNIHIVYPSDIYSPNLFVSIGLALLTTLIALASAGCFALLFGFTGSAPLFFLAIISYMLLEYICGNKKHRNSGVDITLMAATAACISIACSIALSIHQQDVLLPFILAILFTWFAYRFVNIISAAAATLCLLIFVFNVYSSLGQFTIFSFPYLLIAFSAAIYFIAGKMITSDSYNVYHSIFSIVKMVSLCTFYLSGNYYMVDQITRQNYLLTAQSALNSGWIFWYWTMLVPVLFVANGIRSKNLLLIRVGAVLVIISVLTFRYYYTIISAEVAMVTGGGAMVALSYLCMQWLRRPRHGFVYNDRDVEDAAYGNMEAFALSQMLSTQTAPDQPTKFGGGSFGGGGSGSKY